MKKRIFPLFLIAILLTFYSCRPDPGAGFTADKNDVLTDETVTFTNTSEDALSYEWDFGDGTTTTEENPTHAYTATGTYTVTLTAFSKKDKKSDEATDVINVTVPNPSAGFTADKNDVLKNETVTFTNTSEDAFSYLWDFGDGTTSTLENPTHEYTAAGTFTVSLTAFSENKEKSDEATDVITVTGVNVIMYNGTNTPIANVEIKVFGGGMFTIYIFGYDLNCSYINNTWTGIGPVIAINLQSGSGSSIISGTYAFNPSFDGFFYPDYNADIDMGTLLNITDGTLNVVNDGGQYIFDLSCSLDNGGNADVYYEGTAGTFSKKSTSPLNPKLKM